MQKFTSEPIILKTTGMFSRNELRGFLKIGINEVPKIIARFDLPVIEGRIDSVLARKQIDHRNKDPKDAHDTPSASQNAFGVGGIWLPD